MKNQKRSKQAQHQFDGPSIFSDKD